MFGLNMDPRNSNGLPTVAELKQLKLKFARFQFDHTHGGIQFYKGQVAKLHQAGVQSLIVLDYGSIADTQPQMDAKKAVWNTYIRDLAKQAGQVAAALKQYKPAYEIWNEPDDKHSTGTYRPKLKPAIFAQMLTACHQAIKTATNWQSEVIVGGLDSGIAGWLGNVLDSLDPTNPPFDAVGVHPYDKRPVRTWPPHGPNYGDQTGYAGDLLLQYHNVLLQRHVPASKAIIWVTEYGVRNKNKQQQADTIRLFYKNIKANYPYVQQILWFCYSDAMGLPTDPPMGLVGWHGNKQAPYWAYEQASSE